MSKNRDLSNFPNGITVDISNNHVGIGSLTPVTELEVSGQIRITGGNPGSGYVLTSDASGIGSWQPPTSAGITSQSGVIGVNGAYVSQIDSNFVVDVSSLSGLIGNSSQSGVTGGTGITVEQTGGNFVISGTVGSGVVGVSGISVHQSGGNFIIDGALSLNTDIINFLIDASPEDITTGIKAYTQVPYNCEVTQWYVLARQSGTIVFDIKSCNFTGYPSTASIVNGDYPLVSGQIQNSNLNVSWSQLYAGQLLEFSVESNSAQSGVQTANVFLKTRAL